MTETQEIVQTILAQMGGAGRLRVMAGATNILHDTEEGRPLLRFQFKGCRKANLCRVLYDAGHDSYDMELWKASPSTGRCERVFHAKMLYAVDLVSTFEGQTGVRLSL